MPLPRFDDRRLRQDPRCVLEPLRGDFGRDCASLFPQFPGRLYLRLSRGFRRLVGLPHVGGNGSFLIYARGGINSADFQSLADAHRRRIRIRLRCGKEFRARLDEVGHRRILAVRPRLPGKDVR